MAVEAMAAADGSLRVEMRSKTHKSEMLVELHDGKKRMGTRTILGERVDVSASFVREVQSGVGMERRQHRRHVAAVPINVAPKAEAPSARLRGGIRVLAEWRQPQIVSGALAQTILEWIRVSSRIDQDAQVRTVARVLDGVGWK